MYFTFHESVVTLILCSILISPKLPYEQGWIFHEYTFMLPNQLLYYTFRLSINWHVAVVLKNNEFSVTISYLLHCFHVICIFFCVQCSIPAELPTLVCSYTKQCLLYA